MLGLGIEKAWCLDSAVRKTTLFAIQLHLSSTVVTRAYGYVLGVHVSVDSTLHFLSIVNALDMT